MTLFTRGEYICEKIQRGAARGIPVPDYTWLLLKTKMEAPSSFQPGWSHSREYERSPPCPCRMGRASPCPWWQQSGLWLPRRPRGRSCAGSWWPGSSGGWRSPRGSAPPPCSPSGWPWQRGRDKRKRFYPSLLLCIGFLSSLFWFWKKH